MLRKKIITNYSSTKNSNKRLKYGIATSLYGIITNLILFVSKLIVGFISGSVAIISDAINNLSDGISSFVTLFGFKLSSKPADEEHPFGHARYEYISAFLVALIICVLGVVSCISSFNKILNPSTTSVTWVVILILGISVCIKFSQFIFFNKCAKAIDSDSMKATATDARDDTIATAGTLVAMIFILIFNINIDAYVGLVLSIIVIVSGFKILLDTINPLIGEKPDKQLVDKIRKKLSSYDGVLGFHELIIHSYGKNKYYVSVHIEVSADVDPLITHDMIDDIEEDFQHNLGIHIVIHSDAIQNNNKLVAELKTKVQEILTALNPELVIHDFRLAKGQNNTEIMFDCIVPYTLQITKQQIIKHLKDNLDDSKTKYKFSIDIDRDYI